MVAEKVFDSLKIYYLRQRLQQLLAIIFAKFLGQRIQNVLCSKFDTLCPWDVDTNFGEKNDGTVPSKSLKFKNFLPYGSMGCHILQWQKKEENDKEDK